MKTNNNTKRALMNPSTLFRSPRAWLLGLSLAVLFSQTAVMAGPITVALVKAINQSLSGSGSHVEMNGRLFFFANDGSELWKSDGTAAGTALVKDILPGPSYLFVRGLTAVGNVLYFTADDGFGRALWKSDGTAAGTVRIKDTVAGSLTAVGNTLFFVAHDATSGYELWKSNGTGARNHGEFVSCVNHLLHELKQAGLITGEEQSAISRCARISNLFPLCKYGGSDDQ